MEILTTHNLCKQYKDRYAVRNVNMHLSEGDIYGFVGENGAGKTTLIRMVAGLISPTSGSYSLFGTGNGSPDIRKARRNMAGIVESVSLNPGMTAQENLRFQAMLTGSSRTVKELTDLLEFVGLNTDAVQNRKVRNFSLGMRQRLGIALVMVSRPRLILLDEPMNGLDPEGMIQMRDILLRLREQGVTILISSHILSELDRVCTRIGLISHGALLEELTIEELRKKGKRRTDLVSDRAEALRDALTRSLHLTDTELCGNTLTVFDDIPLNDLIDAVSAAKLPVSAFRTREDSVEDYYIQKIRGGEPV